MSDSILLDKTLSTPWGTAREDVFPDADSRPHPPYIAHFKTGAGENEKELIYIAQDHHPVRSMSAVPSFDDLRNNTPRDPSFRAVAYAIEQYKPDAIVLEGDGDRVLAQGETGFEMPQQFDPKYVKDLMGASKHTSREHAIFLGWGNSKTIVSGEASSRSVFGRLMEQGYTQQEIISFYILRCIPQWREQNGGSLTEDKLRECAEHFLNNTGLISHLRHGRQKLSFDYARFEQWYNEHAVKDGAGNPVRSLFEFTADDHLAPGTSYFQQFGATVQDIREEDLNSTIQSLYDQGYKRVMVDWGEEHFLRSKPVYTGNPDDRTHKAFDTLEIVPRERFDTPEKNYWQDIWPYHPLHDLAMPYFTGMEHTTSQLHFSHVDAAQTAGWLVQQDKGITPENIALLNALLRRSSALALSFDYEPDYYAKRSLSNFYLHKTNSEDTTLRDIIMRSISNVRKEYNAPEHGPFRRQLDNIYISLSIMQPPQAIYPPGPSTERAR